MTISNLKVKQVNVSKIFQAIIHQDFSGLWPSIPGNCFFLNPTTNLALYLYDDRGLDVAATRKETLLPIYQQHKDWILKDMRKEIEDMFAKDI